MGRHRRWNTFQGWVRLNVSTMEFIEEILRNEMAAIINCFPFRYAF